MCEIDNETDIEQDFVEKEEALRLYGLIVEFCEYKDDVEELHYLPGKYAICENCSGHGYVLNPNIGNHCYSMEEFNEAFSEPEDKEQYFKRGGIYDVECPHCQGQGKAVVVDESKCDPVLFEKYQKDLADRAQYARESAYTRRMENGGWDY
jgi:hypothetical protein